jgi:glycosyltransferase involved in cell wall biosynthesis
MKEKIPVTIVIPTKNEERHLPRLLKSIKEQSVEPLEIILADANSADRTLEIAKEYGVKIVEGGSPSEGRNRGAELATGDVIIFMDADTYFIEDNDLIDIYNKFKQQNYDIASCYFKSDDKTKATQGLLNFLKWFGTRRYNKILKWDFGAFLIVKKDPFQRVNGFDERVQVMEDVSIIRKFNRLGYSQGLIRRRIGITLSLKKREKNHLISLKRFLGVLVGYVSVVLSSWDKTEEFAYKLNKKAQRLHGELGGIVHFDNPNSPEDRSQGYPLEISKRERRFWEIMVGFFSWFFILLPILLAIFKLETIFVIYVAFLVAYWGVRTVKFVAGISIGYKRYRKEIATDWMGKIRSEYQEEFDKLNFVYLCPVYAEDLDVLEPSFEAFSESTVGADKIDVVLAVEEKKAEFQKENFHYLKEKFGNKFRSMQYYIHPAEIPGEIAGVKGANINWATRHFVKELEDRGENIENYLLVTCDSDMRPHKKYLSSVAYKYFQNGEERDNYYYASAIHTFQNNIWDVPHIIRAQSNMLTLVLLYGWVFDKKKVLTLNGEEMYVRDSFSSYVVNLKTLKDFKYWDPEIANDDTAFYWNAMVRSKGTFKSQEVYIPTYNDAVQNKSYWKSHVSYYKQQHRWGWGSINVPITLAAIAKDNNNFPLLRKLAMFRILFEYQVWYLSVVFVLTFGLYIMGIINPRYSFTVYSYNLAQVMSVVFTFITLLNIPIILYRRKIIPVPDDWKWWRHVLDFAEIIFITVNMLTFGFIPYMQAKTELMLGLTSFRRNFYVTEKVRRNKEGSS